MDRKVNLFRILKAIDIRCDETNQIPHLLKSVQIFMLYKKHRNGHTYKGMETYIHDGEKRYLPFGLRCSRCGREINH